MDLPLLLLPLLLRILCTIHLALAFVYTLLQLRFAACCRSRLTTAPGPMLPPPAVDVLVPCYNEDPCALDRCLASLASQDYSGALRVFVVDDASANRAALLPILHSYEQRYGWSLTLLDRNRGKRRALDSVLRKGDGTVVVTVDSDTVVLPDGISQIIKCFADERVGAVSANLRAQNWGDNLLTSLINRQYWLTFEQERVAQSHFRAVLCCWGGFVAYRRTALEEVWERHLNQTVGGKPCTIGDDLHLTLELLIRGYDTVAEPGAMALTQVPSTLRRYALQQLRWSRSFVRELPWAWKATAGRSAYLVFDLAVRTLTPILIAAVALLYVVEGTLIGSTWLAHDLFFVVAALFGTTTFGAIQARDLRYLLYCPVYLGLILPGWLGALVSFSRNRWGTRELPPAASLTRSP